MTIRPTNEIVARAWLFGIGLPAGKVATTLPDQPWPDDEFVQIMQVGGTPHPEIPVRQPVVTVNCFATRAGSVKPPWGKASALAELIWEATFVARHHSDLACLVTMPDGYGRALVRTVTTVSGEPRRVPSDPSQYAVYSLDLMFDWIPVDLVVGRQ